MRLRRAYLIMAKPLTNAVDMPETCSAPMAHYILSASNFVAWGEYAYLVRHMQETRCSLVYGFLDQQRYFQLPERPFWRAFHCQALFNPLPSLR